MKIKHNNTRVLGRHTRTSESSNYYYFQELAIKYTSQKATSKNFTSNEVSFMVALAQTTGFQWLNSSCESSSGV